MKTHTALFLVIAALLVAPNVSGDDFSYADLFKFGDPSKLATGGSTLIRTADDLTMSLSANKLKKGGVYTIWFIIFNDPSACAANPCMGGDLETLAVGGAVIWAAGAIADKNGNARFTGHLNAGPRPDNMDIFGMLMNPMTAEVHFVVRQHPKAKKGEVAAAMATFMGNCGDGGMDCSDDFAAIHLPPP